MSFRGEFAKCEKLLLASFCLFVFPHGSTKFALDRLPQNFIFENISQILLRKRKFHYKLAGVTGTLH